MNKTLLAMLVGGAFGSSHGVAYAGFWDWLVPTAYAPSEADTARWGREEEIAAKNTYLGKDLMASDYKPHMKDGKTVFDIGIYNRDYASAALVVYEKDGKTIHSVEKVDGHAPATSLVSFVIDDAIAKTFNGLTDDYSMFDPRDAVNSTKTELKDIEVPEGGSFIITKNSDEAIIINAIDVAVNIFGLVPIPEFSGKKINSRNIKQLTEIFVEAGIMELLKDTSWLNDKNIDTKQVIKSVFGAVGAVITDKEFWADVAQDTKFYDGRTLLGKTQLGKAMKNTGKLVEDVGKAVGTLATIAEIGVVSLNAAGVMRDLGNTKNNDFFSGTQDDVIGGYNYIATGSYTSNNPKPILPSAPREPDPSFIHQITLGSLPSNSDIGSPRISMVNNTDFVSMEDIAAGFKQTLIATNGSSEKNTNTNPVQSGQQQSTFLNTQPFSSTDWIVKEGASNNFVKTESFGSVIAPNNKPMAALNNANASHTVMERTFTIPTGVKNVSLGFNANFITNEFPAFVGSQFNDNVKVEIVTASGNLYEINNPIPFKESLNASQLTPVTGLPSPMQPDGGQTGFKPIDVTNIPVAGGGAVTVRVTVENTGDQLYPSAALISDTQAKPR